MPQQSPTSSPSASQSRPRLFFALWPGALLRDSLYKASRRAVYASDGKPVTASNLHMTLVFLGHVSVEAMDAVRTVAASVRGEAFHLSLDQLGYWHAPQVLWCGARETPSTANALAGLLRKRLVAAGFKPDMKEFIPHVTLARKVKHPGPLGAFGPLAWDATGFTLVRSIAGAEGSEYSPLETYALDGGDVKLTATEG